MKLWKMLLIWAAAFVPPDCTSSAGRAVNNVMEAIQQFRDHLTTIERVGVAPAISAVSGQPGVTCT